MVTKLKEMRGEEFVKKMLEGERDFSGIELQGRFNLSDYELFQELQDYLLNQNLQKNPVVLNGSEFGALHAEGLYLPFVIAEHANFGVSHLRGANLEGANLISAQFVSTNLSGANLRYTCLAEANLYGAMLMEADLYHADLGNANLRGADLAGANLDNAFLADANLSRANLTGAKNLESAVNLRQAVFGETKVTPAEKEIIENVLANRKLFVVVK
jgi:uncharacterized protein YjbI with pentapeptide repeats